MIKNGFTLVELMVTVAIMGILFMLGAPLMNNLTKVKEKQQIYIKMDNSMGKTMELIKRTARSAEQLIITSDTGTEYTKDLNNAVTTGAAVIKSTTYASIILRSSTETIPFNYDVADKTIYVGTSTSDTIGENISAVQYVYSERLNMLKISITSTIKDSTSTSGAISRTISDVVQSRMISR